MVYKSVEQIFADIDKRREQLIGYVENLTSEQAASRRASDAWTINEIVEHISEAESSTLRLVTRFLEQAESKGIKLEDNSVLPQPFSIETLEERAKGERFKAPDFLVPKKAAPIAASLESLNQTRASLNALRTRLEAVDLSESTFPHPAFGLLNAYQYLALIGLHEARHIGQIKETLETNKVNK